MPRRRQGCIGRSGPRRRRCGTPGTGSALALGGAGPAAPAVGSAGNCGTGSTAGNPRAAGTVGGVGTVGRRPPPLLEAFEERAAILEHDEGLSREAAELRAAEEAGPRARVPPARQPAAAGWAGCWLQACYLRDLLPVRRARPSSRVAARRSRSPAPLRRPVPPAVPGSVGGAAERRGEARRTGMRPPSPALPVRPAASSGPRNGVAPRPCRDTMTFGDEGTDRPRRARP